MSLKSDLSFCEDNFESQSSDINHSWIPFKKRYLFSEHNFNSTPTKDLDQILNVDFENPIQSDEGHYSSFTESNECGIPQENVATQGTASLFEFSGIIETQSVIKTEDIFDSDFFSLCDESFTQKTENELLTIEKPTFFNEEIGEETHENVFEIQPSLDREIPIFPHDSNMFASCNSNLHNISMIPKKILNLYNHIKSSHTDWTFAHVIAAQMCQEFLPMKSHVELKMSLLLSIVSIEKPVDRTPISVVAIGRDTSFVHRIMHHIGNCAERFLSPVGDYSVATVDVNNFVTAGPVALASGGVCYLGDWALIKQYQILPLQKLIETGEFIIQTPQLQMNLETAIWSYWSYSGNLRKDIYNLNFFSQIFGIPVFLEEYSSANVIDFIFYEAANVKMMDVEDELSISYDDMKAYLRFVTNITVEVTSEASELLNAYIDTTRRCRSSVLSLRAFSSMLRLAESYAKICLRNQVLVCDVLAVILIAEKYIYGIFGIESSDAPIQETVQDIEDVDNYMKEFVKWTYSYVGYT